MRSVSIINYCHRSNWSLQAGCVLSRQNQNFSALRASKFQSVYPKFWQNIMLAYFYMNFRMFTTKCGIVIHFLIQICQLDKLQWRLLKGGYRSLLGLKGITDFLWSKRKLYKLDDTWIKFTSPEIPSWGVSNSAT